MNDAAEKVAEQRLDEDDLVHSAIKIVKDRSWGKPVFMADTRDANGRIFGGLLSDAVNNIRSLRQSIASRELEIDDFRNSLEREREDLAALLAVIPEKDAAS